MKALQVGIAVLVLAFAAPALAKGKGHGKEHGNEQGKEQGKEHGHGAKFDGDERGELQTYFSAHPDDSRLPPGLAKKGKVPPGWRKKLAVGQPVPPDLWELRAPLPPEIVVRLPVPPLGVELIRIGDQILKIRRETHEVLDRIGLPHPP